MRLVLAAAIALATPLTVLATEADTPPPLLAAACANCHGPDGRGAWPIASIAGRPFNELLRQLTAYRENDPIDEATVMPRLMAGYSEADIETLARWFSSLPGTPEATP